MVRRSSPTSSSRCGSPRGFGAHDAGGAFAECDDLSTGECGHIDEQIRVLRTGVGERIGEDESALGIGVRDLDGLASHMG